LSYLLIYKIVVTRKLKLVIPLGVVMVVAVQTDPSNFSTLLLIVILWFLFKLPLKSKYTLGALLILLLSHIPLIIFDLRHDFLNTKALLKFFAGSTGAGINLDLNVLSETLLLLPRSFARFFWVFGEKDVAVQIAPSAEYILTKYRTIPILALIGSVTVLISFFIDLQKDKKNLAKLIIGLHLIIALTGIAVQNVFFGNWNFEWLMQVLFPAYAIISAIILNKIISIKWLKIPLYLLIFTFILFSTKVILTSPNSYNLSDKTKAVKFAIQKVDKQPFALDSIGKNFAWGGYRYLFYLYGHEPVKSYMDPVFADWMYPKESLTKEHPPTVVAIMNPDFYIDPLYWETYQRYLDKTITRKNFGRIEVLIIDNSERWVDW